MIAANQKQYSNFHQGKGYFHTFIELNVPIYILSSSLNKCEELQESNDRPCYLFPAYVQFANAGVVLQSHKKDLNSTTFTEMN